MHAILLGQMITLICYSELQLRHLKKGKELVPVKNRKTCVHVKLLER